MFATTLGLSAVALRGDPAMRTLSPEDVSAGLPASAAAAALLGEAGAVCVLIVIFLAITSATSAELIAVSSILTYDVYQVRDQLLDEVWFLLLRMYWVSLVSEIFQPTGYGGGDLDDFACDSKLDSVFFDFSFLMNVVIYHQVALFASVMAILGLIFFYIGISMGWLYVCPPLFTHLGDD